MTYKKQIKELLLSLNNIRNVNASLEIEKGCYYLTSDGKRSNPFSPSGYQPSKSGTGLYLYLLGIADAMQ